MAKAITTEMIILPNVRLSFPSLWKPTSFGPGGKEYFKASFLLDPSVAEHAAKLAELKAIIKDLTAKAFDGQALPPERVCVQNGSNKKYDGYANMVVLSATNTVRPVVMTRSKAPAVEGEPQAPYAGCYVNAGVTLWTQDNQYGKRINANLRAVQFVRDGAAFGSGPLAVDDEFDALPDEEGEKAEVADWM